MTSILMIVTAFLAFRNDAFALEIPKTLVVFCLLFDLGYIGFKIVTLWSG